MPTVVEIVRLFVGRGLRADPISALTEEETEDQPAQLELAVNLLDLGPELNDAMLVYEQQPNRVWLPLTTTVGGVPELVWETEDGLVPTAVPVPHPGVEDATVPAADVVFEEEA